MCSARGSTTRRLAGSARRAFLMEIDPLYCDVIVTRYERFAGKPAERMPAGADTDAAAQPAQPAPR
jgi:hypothetical protein